MKEIVSRSDVVAAYQQGFILIQIVSIRSFCSGLSIAGAVLMEGDDKPETIDVWELMKDLDEDDTYTKTRYSAAVSTSKDATTSRKPPFEPVSLEPPDVKEDPRRRTQLPAIPESKHARALGKLSSDSFTSDPLNVKEVPKLLTSFQTHGMLERSFAGAGEGSSREIAAHGKPWSRQLRPAVSTSRVPDMSNVKFAGPTQETLTEHLQKSLSFEASAKDEMKRIFGKKDAINAFYSKELKVEIDTEASSSSSSRPPREVESPSSHSTVSSSISKSLRKWFQEDVRKPKQREEGGHETKKKRSQQQASPSPAHGWKLSWPISKMAGASANVRSSSKSDVNVAADQKPSISSQSKQSQSFPSATDQMRLEGIDPPSEILQQRRSRGLRHSFTLGSWGKTASQAKASAITNRATSLELKSFPKAPKERVVLYTTSARSDVQAFEDCNAARAVLASVVGAAYEERSISQDPQYAQELQRALCTENVPVPTVCIKGRYITGLDNLMQMFKKGILRSLMADSIAEEPKSDTPCVCGGGKFLVCPVCKGKRTLTRKDGEGEQNVSCHHCSATGLIKCPNCFNI